MEQPELAMRGAAEGLLALTPAGLWCPAGEFHIDPLRPAPAALITHAHADHARPGHGLVLAARETLDLMAARHGPDFAGATRAVAPGEILTLSSARVSFHPAGHVLGSAQIRIEARNRRGWLTRAVVSGDYKREADPTCAPFAPLACDVFVTEATFGLPVFRHPPPAAEIARLLASLRLFPERAHLVGAYSLGKAQRLVALLRAAGYDAPVYLHGAMQRVTEVYLRHGVALGALRPVPPAGRRGPGDGLPGQIILCPPGALQERWSRRFADPVRCLASGWMRTRARARQRGVELPLVISDHADWPALLQTVAETGAGQVLVTHGREDALVYWLRQQGRDARPLSLPGAPSADDGAAGASPGDGPAIRTTPAGEAP